MCEVEDAPHVRRERSIAEAAPALSLLHSPELPQNEIMKSTFTSFGSVIISFVLGFFN